MAEWLRIARSLAANEALAREAVLATVVRMIGSSYRRPGAKLLLYPDGRSTGAVSGGCLESDVLRRAQAVLRTGIPQLVRYDTTRADDAVLGIGLGCQGVVDIFIERLAPLQEQPGKLVWLAEAASAAEEGESVAVVSVISVISVIAEESLGRTKLATAGLCGGSLMVSSGGAVRGQIADAEVQGGAVQAGEAALAAGRPVERRVRCGAGEATVFADLWLPPPALFIFGAGADAVPMLAAGKTLGWRVTVVDHRPAYLASGAFAAADATLLCRPEEAAVRLQMPRGALVVVMNHNFTHDVQLLKWLLAVRPAYLGLLGPKSRTVRLLQALESDGTAVDADLLASLYAPMGLDIGAETAEEIALAATAEMQAVLTARAGGFLRDRQGSIHA